MNNTNLLINSFNRLSFSASVIYETAKTVIKDNFSCFTEYLPFIVFPAFFGVLLYRNSISHFDQGKYAIATAEFILGSGALFSAIIACDILFRDSEMSQFHRDSLERKKPSESEMPESCPDLEIEEFQKCENYIEEAKRLASMCQVSHRPYNHTRQFQLPKDRGLASNLKFAYEILSDTLNIVRFSPNNMERSWKLIRERARQQGIFLDDKSDLDMRCFLNPLIKNDCFQFVWNYAETQAPFYDQFSQQKIKSVISNKMSFGNCGEMSSVALFKGMEKGIWNTPLHVLGIANGDHEFLVIGQPDSAVVVDAWNKRVYPIKDIANHLYDYIGTDYKTGQPQLKQFDPATQQLEVRSVNIFPMDSIVSFRDRATLDTDQSKIYDEVIQHMNRFHQTEYLDEKLVSAEAVSKLCDQSQMRTIPFIHILESQVDHFIELSHQWM